MRRASLFAVLLAALANTASGQALTDLHITAGIVDADGTSRPLSGYALLISEEPPSAAPRRILIGADGTASVRIRPGTYTVESDQPLIFRGKAYTWTRHVTIVAGQDADLVLNASNAQIEATTATDTPAATITADRSRDRQRQSAESVVAVWTPTTHGSGFLIDAKGLIATTRTVVSAPSGLEVQLPSDVKVAARLLAADAMRDVAILWIDPVVVATMRPVVPQCPATAKAAATASPAVNELSINGIRLRGLQRMTSGDADIDIDGLCELLPLAEQEMADAMPPPAVHLPVEPPQTLSVDGLAVAAKKRAGSLNPSQISSSDFQVAFITPLQVYATLEGPQSRRLLGRTVVPPLFEFGNWADYVADYPAVLLIRVTPKMVESFWTSIGRVAARTQGMDLPRLAHAKTGFARLRLFCGDDEVTPVHPFTIEQPVSERESVSEGLYAYDPATVAPRCGSVRLMLYSEKEPDKADTRVIDMRIVEQVSQDFATPSR
jgi:hypothetical protein